MEGRNSGRSCKRVVERLVLLSVVMLCRRRALRGGTGGGGIFLGSLLYDVSSLGYSELFLDWGIDFIRSSLAVAPRCIFSFVAHEEGCYITLDVLL